MMSTVTIGDGSRQKKPSTRAGLEKMSLFWKEIDARNYASISAEWLSGFAESCVGYLGINRQVFVILKNYK